MRGDVLEMSSHQSARPELRFVPLLEALFVVLVALGYLVTVGFFAAILSGIWVAVISLMLFARSHAVDRPWEEAAQAQPPHTVM
jgi:hypothetical protein